MNKVALITGANQGLGFGLVQRLNEVYEEGDTIYLGVRRVEAGEEAIKRLQNLKARADVIYLDVSKEETIETAKRIIEERHGGIDLVLSNAAARISPDTPNKEQVAQFIQTNNMGTYYMLKYFQPLLNNNGQFIVVASAFGSLLHINTSLYHHFDVEHMTQEDVNSTMQQYVADVEAETDTQKGWPAWINVPSKIGQVALIKIASEESKKDTPTKNTSIFAVCPGLVDTDASRPFFDNMHEAQSPYDAAQHIINLTNQSTDTLSGKLIQFGKELPWK